MKTNENEREIIFEGDLILTSDFKTSKNLVVRGRIYGKDGKAWNINAKNIDAKDIEAWNIEAWNINARNINAKDIDARNINVWNINARNINAKNIDARNIICESREKKSSKDKTTAQVFISGKFELKKKEW